MEFDLADHYFREGIRIKPNSYQAHHALAKNLMERALEQVEKVILHMHLTIWMRALMR